LPGGQLINIRYKLVKGLSLLKQPPEHIHTHTPKHQQNLKSSTFQPILHSFFIIFVQN
jgi:hypothetical protein